MEKIEGSVSDTTQRKVRTGKGRNKVEKMSVRTTGRKRTGSPEKYQGLT